MNGVPEMEIETDEATEEEQNHSDEENLSQKVKDEEHKKPVCVPYFQIFKNSERIFC
jgi:hypothetical protein